MSVLFQGTVKIYLQGHNALLITGKPDKVPMTYYIGEKSTKLRIIDFRQVPSTVAQRILKGDEPPGFADLFNQPAKVEVRINEEKVTIKLHNKEEDKLPFILWLGVTNDNTMPNYETRWEFLRPIAKTKTAFAALIEDN